MPPRLGPNMQSFEVNSERQGHKMRAMGQSDVIGVLDANTLGQDKKVVNHRSFKKDANDDALYITSNPLESKDKPKLADKKDIVFKMMT